MPVSPAPLRHRAMLPPMRPPPARRERCHRSHLATSTSLSASPVLGCRCRLPWSLLAQQCAAWPAAPSARLRPCPLPNQRACHLQAHATRRTPRHCPPSPHRFRRPRHACPSSRRCGCLRVPGRSASSPRATVAKRSASSRHEPAGEIHRPKTARLCLQSFHPAAAGAARGQSASHLCLAAIGIAPSQHARRSRRRHHRLRRAAVALPRAS